MDLFEIRNNRAFPSTHALLIEPYKSIWNDDNSETKEKAIKYFTYIELMCSPKKSNPFYGYDEDIRPLKVAKEVFGDENYQIDSELLLATIAYNEHLEMSIEGMAMLNTAKGLLHRTREYLETLNVGDTTNAGALKLKPKDILLAISSIPKALEDLDKTKEKVLQEIISEDIKTRNQRKINKFEQ